MAIRLHELGPRVKLSLVKVEEGLCRGNVVFHAHQNKSPKDIKKNLDGLKGKRELKEKRKKIQDENVAKKAEANSKFEKESDKEEKSGDEPADDDGSKPAPKLKKPATLLGKKRPREERKFSAMPEAEKRVRKSGKRDFTSIDEKKSGRVGTGRFNRSFGADFADKGGDDGHGNKVPKNATPKGGDSRGRGGARGGRGGSDRGRGASRGGRSESRGRDSSRGRGGDRGGRGGSRGSSRVSRRL